MLGVILLCGWVVLTAAPVLICLWKRRADMALLLGALCIGLPMATLAITLFSQHEPGLGGAIVALVYALIAIALVSLCALIAALSVEDRRPGSGVSPS